MQQSWGDVAALAFQLVWLALWLALIWWTLFGVRNLVVRRFDALRAEVASLRAELIARSVLPPQPPPPPYSGAWRIRAELFPSG